MTGMTTHRRGKRHAVSEPGTRNRHWPLLLIAAPAAVAIWSGWVGLGGMSGFGVIHPLPGFPWGLDGFRLNSAITLPIGVEAYGAYALYMWLSGTGSQRTRTFAQWSAMCALVLGAMGQVAFHLLVAAHWTVAPWPVVVAVACLPVVTLACAATLVHMLRADAAEAENAEMPVLQAVPAAPVEAIPAAPANAVDATDAAASDAGDAAVEEAGDATEVADAMPDGEPPPSPVRLVKSHEAERGRAEYRKSVRQGQPLSQRALGAKFGKSRQWGADRIREVDGGPALTAQAQ